MKLSDKIQILEKRIEELEDDSSDVLEFFLILSFGLILAVPLGILNVFGRYFKVHTLSKSDKKKMTHCYINGSFNELQYISN